MKRLLHGFSEEMKKESLHLWWRNQGTFLLISSALHILTILILFHLPLYPHQFSWPKIIEVRVIEEIQKGEEGKKVVENKRAAEVSPSNIVPASLKEKTKKIIKLETKKANLPKGEIITAHQRKPKEQVILDKVDLGLDKKYAYDSIDESWANEELIFPEKNADPKSENPAPSLNNVHLAKAANAPLEEGIISASPNNSLAQLGAERGEGEGSTTPKRGGALEKSGEGKGDNVVYLSDSKGGSYHLGSQSSGDGNTKISGGKGTDQGNLSTFLGMARKKIEEAKRYPWEALRRHWEGKVILSFWVDHNGEIKNIKILQSSGYKVLDEEAKATLLRASPLPLPPQMEEDIFKIEVPILFRIE